MTVPLPPGQIPSLLLYCGLDASLSVLAFAPAPSRAHSAGGTSRLFSARLASLLRACSPWVAASLLQVCIAPPYLLLLSNPVVDTSQRCAREIVARVASALSVAVPDEPGDVIGCFLSRHTVENASGACNPLALRRFTVRALAVAAHAAARTLRLLRHGQQKAPTIECIELDKVSALLSEEASQEAVLARDGHTPPACVALVGRFATCPTSQYMLFQDETGYVPALLCPAGGCTALVGHNPVDVGFVRRSVLVVELCGPDLQEHRWYMAMHSRHVSMCSFPPSPPSSAHAVAAAATLSAICSIPDVVAPAAAASDPHAASGTQGQASRFVPALTEAFLQAVRCPPPSRTASAGSMSQLEQRIQCVLGDASVTSALPRRGPAGEATVELLLQAPFPDGSALLAHGVRFHISRVVVASGPGAPLVLQATVGSTVTVQGPDSPAAAGPDLLTLLKSSRGGYMHVGDLLRSQQREGEAVQLVVRAVAPACSTLHDSQQVHALTAGHNSRAWCMHSRLPHSSRRPPYASASSLRCARILSD